MIERKSLTFLCLACAILFIAACEPVSPSRKVGVLYVVHGGSASSSPASSWESSIQIFSYDPNNPIYQRVIWNPDAWPTVVKFGDDQRYANVASQIRKYAFENTRIGGLDPAHTIVLSRFQQLTRQLNLLGDELGVEGDTLVVVSALNGSDGHTDTLHVHRVRA